MDVHFPSCYNPAAGLTNYAQNMAFPTSVGDGKEDCPPGWVHLPHIFFEAYWNTIKFRGRWTPNQGYQPFVLANGDVTGFSAHGDFMAAWDVEILQNIIDNCNVSHRGMENCPNVQANDKIECHAPPIGPFHGALPEDEPIQGVMPALPGNNPLTGWGFEYTSGNSGDTPGSSFTGPGIASVCYL